MNALLAKLGVGLPIIQAPMAGVSTTAMAAAVSDAGGLGSISVGAADVASARDMIRATRAATDRPFNVNLFCHRPPVADPTKEAAWIARLKPEFARVRATPPDALREVYQSFIDHPAMLAMLLVERPPIVSFHFGIPPPAFIEALKERQIFLAATATSLEEGRAVEQAGIDAVVAQGYEAGGHRSVFDELAPDDRLSCFALTQRLASQLSIPVIAAGGVMTGAGIAAALLHGASAAQLGTAFIACPESSAEAAHRAALTSDAGDHTTMTSIISGRPARCVANKFTALGATLDEREVPTYPIAYHLAKSLHQSARRAGEFGYGAHWAGQGAPLARALPAAELVAVLRDEMHAALARTDLG